MKQIQSFSEAERRYDHHSLASINWIFVLALYLMGAFAAVVDVSMNSKQSELDGLLLNYLQNALIPTAIALFHLAYTFHLIRHYPISLADGFRNELKPVGIICVTAVAASVGICYLFQKYMVLNPIIVLYAVFLVFIILYQFTRRKYFTRKTKVMSHYVLAGICILAVGVMGYRFMSRDVWLLQSYINATPNLSNERVCLSYDDNTGIYTVTKQDEDIRILQLTDIHLGGSVTSYSKDKLALEACYTLIERTRPDMVIITGDMTFPLGLFSFSFNNATPVAEFAAFMRNLGIPWAFTYGNHDTEDSAAFSAEHLDMLYQSLSYHTSKTLLYPYTQPQITGRNNQLIEIRNADGSLCEALFLIDSNAYTEEGLNKYDYIHDDQVEWYREQVLRLQTEQPLISSMIFMHIPLQQYRTAYELYMQESPDVTYFFGENDEKVIDKVCASEYPSAIFDVAKELCSTRAFFCGHDHYNNMSLEYEGIRLTYGMSIDYLAMPGIARDTVQRGGTMITIYSDGSFDVEQVPLSLS